MGSRRRSNGWGLLLLFGLALVLVGCAGQKSYVKETYDVLNGLGAGYKIAAEAKTRLETKGLLDAETLAKVNKIDQEFRVAYHAAVYALEMYKAADAAGRNPNTISVTTAASVAANVLQELFALMEPYVSSGG